MTIQHVTRESKETPMPAITKESTFSNATEVCGPGAGLLPSWESVETSVE